MTTPFVTWKDTYALGMVEIDEQHRTLFEIMDKMWHAIVRNEEVSAMVEILHSLELYAVQHFTEEELFMASFHYPHFDKHILLHQHFIQKITDEKERVAKGGKPSLDLLHFLRDWLLNHILIQDKHYADYFEEQQQQKNNKPSLLKNFFKRFGQVA